MRRLLQSDHDDALDILTLLGFRLAKIGLPAAGAAEKLLEEVAETGAAELEVFGFGSAAPLVSAVASRHRSPVSALFPISAQVVVFLALLGVAQHLVGFVDLLEFFLGALFVLGDVGMVLAGEGAKGLADFIVAGRAFHSQGLVIIFEFDRHIIRGPRYFRSARCQVATAAAQRALLRFVRPCRRRGWFFPRRPARRSGNGARIPRRRLAGRPGWGGPRGRRRGRRSRARQSSGPAVRRPVR